MHAISSRELRQQPADATATALRSWPTRPQRRCGGDDHDTPRAERPRGDTLVSAMTEALRSLAPAADGDTLKDSARAFAHELFDALRELGGRGPERARCHGHGHERAQRGYGELSQRLDRLAGELTQPAAATELDSVSLSASMTTANLELSASEDGTSASLSVTHVQLEFSATTLSTGAAAPSPLVAAFSRLLDALQPQRAAASGGVAGDGDRLSGFLRQLADALRGGGADEAPAGALLSLAA